MIFLKNNLINLLFFRHCTNSCFRVAVPFLATAAMLLTKPKTCRYFFFRFVHSSFYAAAIVIVVVFVVVAAAAAVVAAISIQLFAASS